MVVCEGGLWWIRFGRDRLGPWDTERDAREVLWAMAAHGMLRP